MNGRLMGIRKMSPVCLHLYFCVNVAKLRLDLFPAVSGYRARLAAKPVWAARAQVFREKLAAARRPCYLEQLR